MLPFSVHEPVHLTSYVGRLVASQGLAIFKRVCVDKPWYGIILAFLVNITLTQNPPIRTAVITNDCTTRRYYEAERAPTCIIAPLPPDLL